MKSSEQSNPQNRNHKDVIRTIKGHAEQKKKQQSLPLFAPPSYLRSIVWLVPQAI